MKKSFLVLFLVSLIMISNLPTNLSKIEEAKKSELNKTKVMCSQITKTIDCYNNSSCGWCGENNSCIAGNKDGPLSPCKKTKFFYEDNKNWSPQTAGTVNIHTSGKFVLTKHPNLKKILVNNTDEKFRKNKERENEVETHETK